jgi:hypothetical protein
VIPRDGVQSHEHVGNYGASAAYAAIQPSRDPPSAFSPISVAVRSPIPMAVTALMTDRKPGIVSPIPNAESETRVRLAPDTTRGSLANVRDQIGHRSIQVTVDLCGHLVTATNCSAVDRLDDTHLGATPAQPAEEDDADQNAMSAEKSVVSQTGIELS